MDTLRGQLLIASPRLPDANFYHTVVLIIHHDDQGAFGVVLNRLANNTVAEVWEMIADGPCENQQPINLGGPVAGPLMALHTSEACSENEILPGVHFTTQKDNLNRLVRERNHSFRIFSGYAGWAAGQLENEMQVGGWMTLPASDEYIFGDAEGMWKLASQEVGEGITFPLLGDVDVPDDPSFN
ncbi:MAG: YqgE/AlgH family protein [Planctomycetes bacterium]|nr:YqgE/AlgH family protein [Planctomycetota bacterium]MBL7039245.1 YqgE/AlgH family protein [Pirellulaceae bacterium]